MNTKGIKKIRVFIPGIKKDSDCRGYWLNDSGKIEKDFIRVNSCELSIEDNTGLNSFYKYLDILKKIKTNGKPQDCIFYTIGNVGYVYYSRDKIQILPSRIFYEIRKQDLKYSIPLILKVYKGLTIHKENKKYYIEIFKGL